MTSRWRILAPPRSTRVISSASRAKSADSMEGTISTICGLIRFYHSGEKSISSVAAGQATHFFDEEGRRNRSDHRLILLGLERAGGVDQHSVGRDRGAGIGEER